MTRTELESFLAVVQAGSLSAAAKNLYITQPALSRRIQSLEQELGYPLLQRSPGVRKITMTPQGEQFVSLATQWMGIWNEAQEIPARLSRKSYTIATNDSSGQIQGGDFEDAMGACVSTEFLIDAESGDMVFGPTTEETKEYIELFIQCMNNGWIDPDWVSFTGNENPLFADGSIATCDQIYMQLLQAPQRLGFGLTPCPVPHREGYGAGQLAIGELAYPMASAGGGIAITTACNDLEGAMKMIDWMYSDEGADIINYGWVEGETYDVVDGEKVINAFYSANNEDYGCGNKSLYTNDRDFGYTYPNLALVTAADVQISAANGWTVDPSNEAAIYLRLPDAVRLNSEESNELNTLISDLSTYIQTTMLGWMNRTVAFSDAEWDEFCATCDAMSLGKIQAGYEAAYQRYLDK